MDGGICKCIYCINRLDAHNNNIIASRCTVHGARYAFLQTSLFVNQYTQRPSWFVAESKKPNKKRETWIQTGFITNFIKTFYNKIKSATLKMASKTFNTNGFFDFNYYYCFTIGSTLTESISEMQCAFPKRVHRRQRTMYSKTLIANKPKWIRWMHFIIQIKITATMDAFIGGQALLFVMFSDCKIMLPRTIAVFTYRYGIWKMEQNWCTLQHKTNVIFECNAWIQVYVAMN